MSAAQLMPRFRRGGRRALVAIAGLLAVPAMVAGTDSPKRTISVFDGEIIGWKKDRPEIVVDDGFVARFDGQSAIRAVELPEAAPPGSPAVPRIVARVRIEPVGAAGRQRPNDPWPRLGRVTVGDVEIMRFVTGFGGSAEYEQDVTALAPAMGGPRSVRLFLSTFSDEPGWRASLELEYEAGAAAARRPSFARQVIDDPHVTADSPVRRATIDVPAGLDAPRLRILSTGHSTDGKSGNEFVSCPHVVRIDGHEVARFRPWSERGASAAERSPWAARTEIGGRTFRSSDFDRSGWHPGLVVEPLLIPARELSAGRHEIEVEIAGIRPKDPPDPADPGAPRDHGYWVVSVAVVADAAWPR